MSDTKRKKSAGLIAAALTVAAGVVVTVFKDDILTMLTPTYVEEFGIVKDYVNMTNAQILVFGADSNSMVTYLTDDLTTNVVTRGVQSNIVVIHQCVRLQWPTQPGASYSLKYREGTDDPWHEIRVTLKGTGNPRFWYDQAVNHQKQWRLMTF